MPKLVFNQGRAARRARRSERGFLLLDALVALFVTSLLIAYGLSAMTTSASASDAAKQTTTAYNAARQAVENVRAFSGAKIPVNLPYKGSLLGEVPQLAQLGPAASGTMTVQEYAGRAGVKRVSVTVTFPAGGGRKTRAVTLTTLVAPGGVML